MPTPSITAPVMEKLRSYQKDEITEYHIYSVLSGSIQDAHNREILQRMAKEELHHYTIWQRYTGEDITPDWKRVWFYYLVSRIFGLTFGIKLMERVEGRASWTYESLIPVLPEAEQIMDQEKRHESEIIALIDEQRLQYVGSIVLGLNDALVEFTGTLAGLTFALQNSRLIALVGLIMGIAASLSMAASEYLSQKSDARGKSAFIASIYTGTAYIVTVAVLIMPFLLLESPFMALPVTLAGAIAIIILFTWYTSVAQDLPFFRRFLEMAGLSLGIAAISFVIGIAIRVFLQVTV